MIKRLFIFVFLAVAAGCGPEIGDKCSDSTDCATDGSRFCDDTQPQGYCLIPGCRADECPEESVCVRFDVDERARTFCLKHCENNGDCRGGYQCYQGYPAAEVDGLPVEIIDSSRHGRQFCLERAPE